MKKLIAAGALFAAAACGQPVEAPAPEPEAPQTLSAQLRAQSAEMKPVFAYQQLVVYLQAHPEMAVSCTGPRRAEGRGTVPENVAPDSVYAGHAGAEAYSIQCGQQLTTVRDEPREHWIVFFAPDANEVQVVNCATPQGLDGCRGPIPTAP